MPPELSEEHAGRTRTARRPAKQVRQGTTSAVGSEIFNDAADPFQFGVVGSVAVLLHGEGPLEGGFGQVEVTPPPVDDVGVSGSLLRKSTPRSANTPDR